MPIRSYLHGQINVVEGETQNRIENIKFYIFCECVFNLYTELELQFSISLTTFEKTTYIWEVVNNIGYKKIKKLQ